VSQRSFGAEDGLVGKLVVIVLAVVVLVAVAAVDTGSILLARVRTTGLAQDAAFAAAERYGQTGSRRQSVRAALAAIADRDDDARLRSLRVTDDGRVTVVVSDQAWTLLTDRIPPLRDLATVTAKQDHAPV
jgi:hypothetical protein